VFDVCLEDDAVPSSKLVFNSVTGQYRYCCGGTLFTGTGTVSTTGCIVTLNVTAGTTRVTARLDKTQFKGSASLQSPPGTMRCVITDRNTKNNVCICP
jgi:hypothetical protein